MSRRLVVFVVAVLLVSGCASGSGAGSDAPRQVAAAASVEPETSTPASAPSDEQDPPPQPTGPLTIALEAESASQIIGPDGGSIEVTSASGAHFLLEVPEAALTSDVEVTATPASIGNLGFDADAVVFEPTGLSFLVPARLVIVPPSEIPIGQQLMIAFSDDGTQFGAAEPQVDATEVALVIQHFSGYGVGTATSPQRATFLERQASDAETRISSELAALMQEQRAAAELAGDEAATDGAVLESAAEAYAEEVVRPRLAAADASCAAAQAAMRTILGYQRFAQLFGITEVDFDLFGLVTRSYPICEREEIEKCKAAKDPVILLTFWVGSLRQSQLLGLNLPIELDEEKAKSICAPRSYTATGGAGDFAGTGTICSLAEPFTISGGGVDVDFTPSSDTAGSYSYGGALSGVAVSGDGVYTVTLSEAGGTINAGGGGQAGGATGSGDEVYTLTPIDPC